jgi:hypothetical protein
MAPLEPSASSALEESDMIREELWIGVDKNKHKKKLLTTKNVHFVKLSKHIMDFTIVFLSLRWSKNIYGTSNLGSG